jgi:hypothetical protein
MVSMKVGAEGRAEAFAAGTEFLFVAPATVAGPADAPPCGPVSFAPERRKWIPTEQAAIRANRIARRMRQLPVLKSMLKIYAALAMTVK